LHEQRGVLSWAVLLWGVLSLAMSPTTVVAQSDSDLAKASQNPVGSMISLPLQNNTNFGIGPEDKKANVLNIQPVYPISLGANWNLVNRAIVPVIYQQEVIPGSGSAFGLGDISYVGYIAPAQPGGLIWGVWTRVATSNRHGGALGERQMVRRGGSRTHDHARLLGSGHADSERVVVRW